MAKNYVDKEELLKEIILSKSRGKLTHRGEEILIDISIRFISKYQNSYVNSYNYALSYMLKNYYRFDESKHVNPFTYFGIVFKSALFASHNNYLQRPNNRKKKIKKLFKF